MFSIRLLLLSVFMAVTHAALQSRHKNMVNKIAQGAVSSVAALSLISSPIDAKPLPTQPDIVVSKEPTMVSAKPSEYSESSIKLAELPGVISGMRSHLLAVIDGDTDIFRDTPLRYMGYANEVGESFKPLFPRFLTPSYGLAFAYVGADAFCKAVIAQAHGDPTNEVVRLGTDALLWQTLASVLIPGNIIAFITSLAVKTIRSKVEPDDVEQPDNEVGGDSESNRSLPSLVRTWGPTAVGLMCIPLIIHPIDETVTFVFDNTIRSWWH
mmetsp:Transcript_21753/g.36385  ORF Transcript_21753/g.36385 Transcript_21753/m.36385 type:complete len:268 (-) Transcript_21753:80-883(-)